MSLVEELKKRIRASLSSTHDLIPLEQAFEVAQRAHQDQTRDEGTPYIFHPLKVALILSEEFNVHSLHSAVLAVLHDVPEKVGGQPSEEQLSEIRSEFGNQIAEELATLTTKIGSTREERDAFYIGAIREAPLHVKLVKLADRLDNVRSLKHNPSLEKRIRYIHETERDFLPLADETSPIAYKEISSALREAKLSTISTT